MKAQNNQLRRRTVEQYNRPAMMPRLSIPLLLSLALLTASCGFKHEPIGNLPPFPQTVHDGLDREIVIDKTPKRIVSLDPGMTAALYSIGSGKLAVGGSGKETYPRPALKLPAMLAGDGTIDIKALKHALPDIVLAPASLVPTKDDANKLQLRVGASVYVVRATSVAGVENDIGELGLMTGHADQARGLANRIQSRVGAVTKAVAGLPRVKTFVDVGLRFTIAPGQMPSDLIRLADGLNVAAEADPSQAYTISQLNAAAPEVYLSQAGQGWTLADLLARKGLAGLPAVQQKRVVELPESTLYEDGPRVGDALAEIARALHPGLQITP
jgi:iron complex transport system substrate-binding protein